MKDKSTFINPNKLNNKKQKRPKYIQNLVPIKSHEHKKKYIELENTISQAKIPKNDYGFVCEYIEFLVLEADKKKPL